MRLQGLLPSLLRLRRIAWTILSLVTLCLIFISRSAVGLGLISQCLSCSTSASCQKILIGTLQLFSLTEQDASCSYNDALTLQWRQEKQLCAWFTTFKDTVNRSAIQLNTVNNWCKFRPYRMQPILFAVNSTEYDGMANRTGWLRQQVPAVNAHGTPFLNDMISVMINSDDTPHSLFYGFANGDILFDESLPATLHAVAAAMERLPLTPILITGRRTNFEFASNKSSVIRDFFIVEEMRKRGELYRTDAEDYFFFTRDFPWHAIKRLVIGRPAYDNYLVAMARRLNVTVIDTTKTLTALHQMAHKEGNEAGSRNPDGDYNTNIIGKFRFSEGVTTRVAYETLPYEGQIRVGNRQTKEVF
jgi:hypothetical protein